MDPAAAAPDPSALLGRMLLRFPQKAPLRTLPGPLPEGALRRHVRAAPGPILLSQQGRDLAARPGWSFAALQERGRGVPVEVSLGVVEQHGALAAPRDLGRYLAELQQGGGAPPEQASYLSLFPLFEVFPDLAADIAQVDRCFGPLCRRYRRAWIGPAGTVTGLHADHYPNLLVQVVGRKALLLFPPDAPMYPSRTYDYGTTLSQVDLLTAAPPRYPDLFQTPVTLAELGPGDVLYNPPGWWHLVMSLTPSLSVSCFAAPLGRALSRGAWDLGRAGLHALGLYRRGDCLCHPRRVADRGGPRG